MALVLTGLFLYCRFTSATAPYEIIYYAHLHPIERCRSIGTTRRDNYRMLMVGLPQSTGNHRVCDELRRDGRHDAATGRQRHPARAVAAPALQSGYTILIWTATELYRRVLGAISEWFTVAMAFSISHAPLLFGRCHWHPAPVFIAKDVRRR